MSIQVAIPGEYLPSQGWTAAPSLTPTDYDDAYTDKVGGVPMYVKEYGTPACGIVPSCPSCSCRMYLLSQFFVPGSEIDFERILYVFGCNKIECSVKQAEGKGYAFKVIRVSIQAEGEQQTTLPPTSAASSSSATSSSPSSSALAAAKSISTQSTAAPTSSATSKSSAAVSTSSLITDDDEWGAKTTKWSSDEEDDDVEPTPSKVKFAPSPVKPSTTAAAASSSTPTKQSEWGSGGWSDDDDDDDEDEDGNGTSAKSPKKPSADDDDAVLASLLAQQTLARQAAQSERQKAEEAAEAKRLKREEKKAAKAKQAHDELLEAARAAASSSSSVGSSSSSNTNAPPPPPTTTAFRPFYLIWSAEPTSDATDYQHEMRLLKEYEQRQLEEGEKDEIEIDSSSTSQAVGQADGEDDWVERRDDELQTFFDRIDRERQQCVRYYGLSDNYAKDGGALFISKKEIDWNAENRIRCEYCGCMKVLEFQLMPKLLLELRKFLMDKCYRPLLYILLYCILHFF